MYGADNPKMYPPDIGGQEPPLMPEPQGFGKYSSAAKDERERIQRITYFLFAYNLCIFVVGGIVLGVGIWMAVDRSFMTFIIGSDLYSVAIYLVLLGGGFVFFISFMGCCGAITENRCLLVTFCGVLCFLFVVLLLGGIIAIAFSAQIGEAVQETMTNTLKEHYGVNFYNRRNRQITYAWDRAQEKLKCCGVMNNGWDVYRQTKWFEKYGAKEQASNMEIDGSEDQKAYVPQSCCVKDRFWRYVNLDVCQKWRLGPPGSPDDGAINRALYYDGCYNQGLRYLQENAGVLIGLGICVAALLVLGILLSFYLIRYGDKYNESYGN